MIRQLLCWFMVVAWPVSLMAADPGAAMLHTNGTTWVNGVPAQPSAAVFPGDLVQTETNSAANISSSGSSVAIFPGSLVKFESSKLGLEHGSVTVATSKKLAMRAGNVMVTPTSDTWTEFQVSDSNDGKVMIVARKGDVSVQDESGSSTVAAGQQTTRYTAFKDRQGGGAAPAAGGGLLDSPVVIGIGGVAAGVMIGWALSQSGKPFSPSEP